MFPPDRGGRNVVGFRTSAPQIPSHATAASQQSRQPACGAEPPNSAPTRIHFTGDRSSCYSCGRPRPTRRRTGCANLPRPAAGGHVPCPSAAVPAQPTEFCFPAAAVRAVASVPSRFKGGQVRQACHQFTTTAMEGLPVHGVLRASLPDWVSCLAGRSHVEDRFPAGVTGKMPSPSAQHRLVLPYSNQ